MRFADQPLEFYGQRNKLPFELNGITQGVFKS